MAGGVSHKFKQVVYDHRHPILEKRVSFRTHLMACSCESLFVSNSVRYFPDRCIEYPSVEQVMGCPCA